MRGDGPRRPERRAHASVSSPPRKRSSTRCRRRVAFEGWRLPRQTDSTAGDPLLSPPREGRRCRKDRECFPPFRHPRVRRGLLLFAHPGFLSFTPPRSRHCSGEERLWYRPDLAPGPDGSSIHGGLGSALAFLSKASRGTWRTPKGASPRPTAAPATASTTESAPSAKDFAPLRRLINRQLISLRHERASVGALQEPSCCGFATAEAEIGRPAHIVASRRRGAKNYVG